MDETKARALADSLAGTITTIAFGDSFEMDMERAEEIILAFAAEVRRDERERALVAVLRLTADDTAKYGGRQAAIDAIRALPPQAGHDKCPTCDSPKPHLHPAVQYGGEVQLCANPWHAIKRAEAP